MVELEQGDIGAKAVARRAEAIVEALQFSGRSVATAESCSIGHVGRVLAEARGASQVYLGTVVAYTKRSKQRGLGLANHLLTGPMGAVTSDVAIAMAEGVLNLMGASMAVATTGVAGPTPDEDGNPVGRLVVAVAEQGRRRPRQRSSLETAAWRTSTPVPSVRHWPWSRTVWVSARTSPGQYRVEAVPLPSRRNTGSASAFSPKMRQ